MNIFKKKPAPQPESPTFSNETLREAEDGAGILRGLAKLMHEYGGDASFEDRIHTAARAIEGIVDTHKAQQTGTSPLMNNARQTPENVEMWRNIGAQELFSHMRYKLRLQSRD